MITTQAEARAQAFSDLVGYYKTVAAVAKEFEISVTAVYKWRRLGIPVEHCVTAELKSKKKITRKLLRPTDWQKFWPELK